MITHYIEIVKHNNGTGEPAIVFDREFATPFCTAAFDWYHAVAEANGFSDAQQDRSLAGVYRINPTTGETIHLV